MKIKWLPRAEENLKDHLDYIELDSVKAADDVTARVLNQVQQLAEFPKLGRVRRKLGTRELIISNTSLIVVYRLRHTPNHIEIVRILHSSQQWKP